MHIMFNKTKGSWYQKNAHHVQQNKREIPKECTSCLTKQKGDTKRMHIMFNKTKGSWYQKNAHHVQQNKREIPKECTSCAKHVFVWILPFLGSWVWLFPVLLWHSQTQLVYTYDRNTSPSGLEMVKTSALDS